MLHKSHGAGSSFFHLLAILHYQPYFLTKVCVLRHSANVPERSTTSDSRMLSMCLKMVYSKGVFLFPGIYTVNNDPVTCSGNTRLRFRASRKGKVLTALGLPQALS